MLQLTYIFIQKLNRRPLSDGDYALTVAEFVFWAIICGIIRNT